MEVILTLHHIKLDNSTKKNIKLDKIFFDKIQL